MSFAMEKTMMRYLIGPVNQLFTEEKLDIARQSGECLCFDGLPGGKKRGRSAAYSFLLRGNVPPQWAIPAGTLSSWEE
jgi:hypothetical protein